MNLTEIDNSFALLHIYKSTESRLQILKQLVEFWHGSILPEDGIPVAEIENIQMPQILRWWYEWAGNRPDIMSGQNIFVKPSELQFHQGRVVFHVENQGVYLWSTLPGGEDPPVFGRYSDEQQWIPEGIQLSEHLINTCLFEGLLCHAPYSASVSHVSDEKLQELIKVIPPIPIKGWRWSGGSGFYTMRGVFMHVANFEASDGIGHSVWVGAKEREALEIVKPFIDETWEHVEV
jgi:hypothetical protein